MPRLRPSVMGSPLDGVQGGKAPSDVFLTSHRVEDRGECGRNGSRETSLGAVAVAGTEAARLGPGSG